MRQFLRRDAIALWLIEKDGVIKRLRADGDNPRIFRTLDEEGVNLHVELIPRIYWEDRTVGSGCLGGLDRPVRVLDLSQ
jgi:hypothetical protein